MALVSFPCRSASLLLFGYELQQTWQRIANSNCRAGGGVRHAHLVRSHSNLCAALICPCTCANKVRKVVPKAEILWCGASILGHFSPPECVVRMRSAAIIIKHPIGSPAARLQSLRPCIITGLVLLFLISLRDQQAACREIGRVVVTCCVAPRFITYPLSFIALIDKRYPR